MTISGGCLCKAVRYRISAAPIVTRLCWCRVCQYLAAGNATVNVCFPSDALEVSGPMGEFRLRADSGNIAVRRFCSVCGTQLFSASEARPHLVFARAGSLDDPDIARPSLTIWTASAPQWACIDPKLPQLPGQPPPAG
ncbi:MAG: GFA family protein [Gammaproteobacteria bacterium]|nr:GFA family protein [Gammaproteobacteria bacterium]MBV9696762.1 GFA family protein [Gammaproteobacteria bacterium]